MGKGKLIPLASGLISGDDTSLIFGQLEISFIRPNEVAVVIRRKPYSGKPDVKFSLSSTGFKDLIDVICEAKGKLDANWLSIIATNELGARTRKAGRQP